MIQLSLYTRTARYPNVTIRRATKRDLDSLLRLLTAFREETGQPVDETLLRTTIGEMMARREAKLHVFYAKEGRFPVGYLMGVFLPSTVHMGTVFWVQEVFVDKPYRGGPVLRMLHSWTRKYVSSRGAVCIEARISRNALRVRSLSDTLGFDPTAVEVFELPLE